VGEVTITREAAEAMAWYPGCGSAVWVDEHGLRHRELPRLHAVVGPTVRCRCGDPIARCDGQPWHAGCGDGHGWIHAGPTWGHLCGGALGREYGRPWEPAAFTQGELFEAVASG